jgi:hypothetical protein
MQCHCISLDELRAATNGGWAFGRNSVKREIAEALNSALTLVARKPKTRGGDNVQSTLPVTDCCHPSARLREIVMRILRFITTTIALLSAVTTPVAVGHAETAKTHPVEYDKCAVFKHGTDVDKETLNYIKKFYKNEVIAYPPENDKQNSTDKEIGSDDPLETADFWVAYGPGFGSERFSIIVMVDNILCGSKGNCPMSIIRPNDPPELYNFASGAGEENPGCVMPLHVKVNGAPSYKVDGKHWFYCGKYNVIPLDSIYNISNYFANKSMCKHGNAKH